MAEPDPDRRARFGDRHALPAHARYDGWASLLAEPRLADALVLATPDALHLEPAQQALARGYHLLLEKPIAPTLDEVNQLAQAAQDASTTITVAHVLRYAPFFARVAALLREGRIGDLVTVQHTENIGHWHFAHSYVRGNWRREADASPMLLAKACHDLDLLRWLVGRTCTRVASYGGLRHFRADQAPEGSTERCSDGCAVERACPYSALRIYLERFGGTDGWPASVVTPDPTPERLRSALETGPYGRCVYRCDNDVADHQVVALDFAGIAATLTVSAFTERNTRTTHLMGTHGELHGHMETGEIVIEDFTRGTREVEIVSGGPQGGADGGADGGAQLGAQDGAHGGGDVGLVLDFVARLRGERTGPAASDLATSLESHRIAFAAERSRHEARMVSLDEGPFAARPAGG